MTADCKFATESKQMAANHAKIDGHSVVQPAMLQRIPVTRECIVVANAANANGEIESTTSSSATAPAASATTHNNNNNNDIDVDEARRFARAAIEQASQRQADFAAAAVSTPTAIDADVSCERVVGETQRIN